MVVVDVFLPNGIPEGLFCDWKKKAWEFPKGEFPGFPLSME